MLYGFGPPRQNDVVYKISGDILKIRFADRVAREIFFGAVRSTKKDGIRHNYAECLDGMTDRLMSAVSFCAERKWLRPLAWMLKPVVIGIARMNIRAQEADFNKRTFVPDQDGNYTLMFGNPSYEHTVRDALAQLGVTIVSEHFPTGAHRALKPEKTTGTLSHEFTICEHRVKLVLSI